MELEQLALEWAERCEFAHPDPEIYTQYGGIGQSIAVTGGVRLNVTKMASEWYNEVKDYDYTTNTCKEGKACGHYTQVRDMFEQNPQPHDIAITLTKTICW